MDYARNPIFSFQWLSTLGPVLWDPKHLRKEFSVSGKKHVLRGGTSVDIQHVGPTAMQKLLDGKPKGIIAQL